MAVTWVGLGTISHGTGATATPGLPATIVAGDLYLMVVAWANTTNVAPSAPAGWTAPPNNTYVGGPGSFGVDVGPRGVSVFYRIADGTETPSGTVTVTNPGTTPTISAQIGRLTCTGTAWEITVVGGVDTSSGTGYSVTAGSDPGGVNGDHVVAASSWAPDTATSATPTLTWTGTGTNTLTGRSTAANTAGNDLRISIQTRGLTGTSSAAPVYATTLSAAGGGATAIVLVHDITGAALTASLSESAPATDATAKTEGEKRRDLDDTGPAVDTTVKTEGEKRRDTDDTGPATDSTTRTSTRARATGDTAAAADTTSAAVGSSVILRSASDTAAAVDATARATSRTRAAADTAPAADAASRATSRSRGLADTAGGTDTDARLLARARAASDTAPAVDSTAPSTTGGSTRSTADAAPAVDDTARKVARKRFRNEPAPAVDSVDATLTLPRSIGEPTTLADLTSRARSLSRALLDQALAGDTTAPVTVLAPVPPPGRIVDVRVTMPQAHGSITIPSTAGRLELPDVDAALTTPTAQGVLA